MRINNAAAKLTRAVSALAAALFLLVAALFCYTAAARAAGDPMPTVFGWGNAVVLSGSMEPELPVGALLLIHREESYAPGEIVTYEDKDGDLVTHRLISLENGRAAAKGDANNTSDAEFPASQIYGKVRVVLPGVGGTILWLRTPPGICTVLLIGGILLFFPEFIMRKVGKTHDGA